MFLKPEPKAKRGFPCAICRLSVSPRRAKPIQTGGRQSLVHEKCLKRALGQNTNKFGAKKTASDPILFPELTGRSFDSGAERRVAEHLVLLQRVGDIRDLEFQCRFRLTGNFYWKPDFRFWSIALDQLITAECKGAETERWRSVIQLWPEHGPTPLWVYRVVDGDVVLARKYQGGKAA